MGERERGVVTRSSFGSDSRTFVNWPLSGSNANTSPVSILYTQACNFSSPEARPAATQGCVRTFYNCVSTFSCTNTLSRGSPSRCE